MCGDGLDISQDGTRMLCASWRLGKEISKEDNPLQIYDIRNLPNADLKPPRIDIAWDSKGGGGQSMLFASQFSRDPASKYFIAGGSKSNEAKVFWRNPQNPDEYEAFGAIVGLPHPVFTVHEKSAKFRKFDSKHQTRLGEDILRRTAKAMLFCLIASCAEEPPPSSPIESVDDRLPLSELILQEEFWEGSSTEFEETFYAKEDGFEEIARRKMISKYPDLEDVQQTSSERGIYVRDCSDKIGLDGNFIRVASRSFEENLLIIEPGIV